MSVFSHFRSRLLDSVESLEAAVADMQPEPEPEAEFFEVQTEVSSGVLDAWHYVYVQAAHLYSFVPGDGIEVLSRRRVRDKETGEETVAETWHPAVVTKYFQPYLSEPERSKAESDARAEAEAAKQRELEDEEGVADIFKDDDGAKAAAAEARKADRAEARAEKLRGELKALSIGGLRARAAEQGIMKNRIDGARDGPHPKKDLILLIVNAVEDDYESDEDDEAAEQVVVRT